MAWTLRISRPTLRVSSIAPSPLLTRVHGSADLLIRCRVAAARLSLAAGAIIAVLLWLTCIALLVQEMVTWWAEFAVYPIQQAGVGAAPDW